MMRNVTHEMNNHSCFKDPKMLLHQIVIRNETKVPFFSTMVYFDGWFVGTGLEKPPI